MSPPRPITIDSYVVMPTVASGDVVFVDEKSRTTTATGRRSFFQTLKTDAFVTIPPRTRFVVGEGIGKHPGTRAIESYLQALRQPRCVREAETTVCDGVAGAIVAFMHDYGPPGFRSADHLLATPQQWTDQLTQRAKAMRGELNVAGLYARVRGEIGRALEGQIAMLKGRVEGNQPVSPPEMWRMGRLAELAQNWMTATPDGKPDGVLKGSVDTLTTLFKRAVVRGVD